MPRVKYVKRARQDNPVCKAGEPYYWWKFRYGGKRYSLTYPKASQLTQSPFLGGVAVMSETLAAWASSSAEDLESLRDDLMGQARDLSETSGESFDNMPEGLQQGDVGQMLEARRDGMETVADALEEIEFEFDEEQAVDDAVDELSEGTIPARDSDDVTALVAEKRDEWLSEKHGEIEEAAEYDGD